MPDSVEDQLSTGILLFDNCNQIGIILSPPSLQKEKYDNEKQP